MTTQPASPARSGPPVPETNRTLLELYVTPQEAYAMWHADPKNVHIIDIRTFEEYIFVGHADMARNIPFIFPKFQPPAEGAATPAGAAGKLPPGCSGVPNPEFVPTVKRSFAPTDRLLLMCSTGGRAAMAANVLAQAGFVNVYNILTGLEGDKVDDPLSVYNGKRMRNGWKNHGLPWTYTFDTELMWSAPRS